jgi:hypothetical protein
MALLLNVKIQNQVGLMSTVITNPTVKQLERCALCGWEYLGDGLFAKDDILGWFTAKGFIKL